MCLTYITPQNVTSKYKVSYKIKALYYPGQEKTMVSADLHAVFIEWLQRTKGF